MSGNESPHTGRRRHAPAREWPASGKTRRVPKPPDRRLQFWPVGSRTKDDSRSRTRVAGGAVDREASKPPQSRPPRARRPSKHSSRNPAVIAAEAGLPCLESASPSSFLRNRFRSGSIRKGQVPKRGSDDQSEHCQSDSVPSLSSGPHRPRRMRAQAELGNKAKLTRRVSEGAFSWHFCQPEELCVPQQLVSSSPMRTSALADASG